MTEGFILLVTRRKLQYKESFKLILLQSRDGLVVELIFVNIGCYG